MGIIESEICQKIYKRKEINVLYVSVPHFSNVIMGYFKYKISSIKYIVDMKDDWFEANKKLLNFYYFIAAFACVC